MVAVVLVVVKFQDLLDKQDLLEQLTQVEVVVEEVMRIVELLLVEQVVKELLY
jgi:hypothetical protein